MTQSEIWDVVVREVKLNGVVSIHFDEAQHLFQRRNESVRRSFLDSFKSIMKSYEWPLILIFSGVPDLEDFLKEEPQLYRLVSRLEFQNVELPENYETVHEIVGSYAIEANLPIDDALSTTDFYHRLVTAGAYRWGLVIEITIGAISAARAEGANRLQPRHFIIFWVSKTHGSEAATPFTHSSFETMFRRDHPFVDARDQ